MYKTILFCICLFGSIYLSGQGYYSSLPVEEGKIYEKNPAVSYMYPKDSLYRANDYWGYINKQKNETGTRLEKAIEFYNIAACYDRLNMPDETMKYLFDFLNVSPDDRSVLFTNDFKNLRANPEKWKMITDRIDSLYLATVGEIENKELSLRIFYLSIERNASTTRIIQWTKSDGSIEETKEEPYKSESKGFSVTKETNKILKTYGFPTKKEVGRYGVFQIYDVLQHSNILIKNYPKVKKTFDAGGLDSVLFALMTDRMLTHKRKEQIYGTQWERITMGVSQGIMKEYHTKYSGKTLLYKVKDFENVNHRRKAMGFNGTVEEVAKMYESRDYFIPPEYYEQKKK